MYKYVNIQNFLAGAAQRTSTAKQARQREEKCGTADCSKNAGVAGDVQTAQATARRNQAKNQRNREHEPGTRGEKNDGGKEETYLIVTHDDSSDGRLDLVNRSTCTEIEHPLGGANGGSGKQVKRTGESEYVQSPDSVVAARDRGPAQECGRGTLSSMSPKRRPRNSTRWG